MHDNIEVETGAVDVLAENACGVQLTHGCAHAANDVRHLAPDVDESVVRTDRVRGDDDAFEHRVRVRQHDRDVLTGARLTLVSVDNEVVRLVIALWNERPLHASREASATTTAQTGLLDEGNDLVGGHGKSLVERLVSAVTAVRVERVRLGVVPVLRDNGNERHARQPSLPCWRL